MNCRRGRSVRRSNTRRSRLGDYSRFSPACMKTRFKPSPCAAASPAIFRCWRTRSATSQGTSLSPASWRPVISATSLRRSLRARRFSKAWWMGETAASGAKARPITSERGSWDGSRPLVDLAMRHPDDICLALMPQPSGVPETRPKWPACGESNRGIPWDLPGTNATGRINGGRDREGAVKS